MDESPRTAVCVECQSEKPLEAFHRERSRPNGRNRRCKDCRNAINRAHVARDPARRKESMLRWRQANPERYGAAQRAYKLRSYGLSVEAHEDLLREQEGRCAICRRTEAPGWDLSIDHDHRTGVVRGLLCRTCNAGIGLLRDDADVIAAAAAYVARGRGNGDATC